MDGKKWLDRWIGPVRETLEKLSRPQRLSLGLLGASLLVALGMLILSGEPAEDLVLYPTANAEEQITFTSWLDTQRIPYEPRSNGVRIPRSEIEFVNLQARMLKEEGKNQDHFMWVDKAADFQESHRARSDRWSNSLRRSLEDALSRSEGIKSASVTFTPSPRRNTLMNRDLGAQASGDGGADGDVAFSGESAHVQLEGRQEGGEEGCARALAQGFQPLGKVFGEEGGATLTAEGLDGGPRTIRGKLEDGR